MAPTAAATATPTGGDVELLVGREQRRRDQDHLAGQRDPHALHAHDQPDHEVDHQRRHRDQERVDVHGVVLLARVSAAG